MEEGEIDFKHILHIFGLGPMSIARAVGLGVERGLSTQGPHVRRAQKDAGINSCGCGEGPIENVFLQGPELCTTPLSIADSFEQMLFWNPRPSEST